MKPERYYIEIREDNNIYVCDANEEYEEHKNEFILCNSFLDRWNSVKSKNIIVNDDMSGDLNDFINLGFDNPKQARKEIEMEKSKLRETLENPPMKTIHASATTGEVEFQGIDYDLWEQQVRAIYVNMRIIPSPVNLDIELIRKSERHKCISIVTIGMISMWALSNLAYAIYLLVKR